MKIPKIALSLVCLGTCFAFAQDVQISNQGQSDYVIVLPDNPASVLQTAANELASHLKDVTGATYQIVQEKDRPDNRPAFIIGPVKSSASVFKDPTFSNARPDEIAIKFKGKDIFLNGQMPRGPLYATFTFLEDYVGICWWTPEERTIPSLPSLTVSAKDLEYAPKLISRETFYRGSDSPKFAPFLKCNGHFANIPEEYGGHRSIIGWCHTFYQILPPKKYFDAHPEWYSEIDGKRQNGRYQLCLTNEEMRKEFVKVALELIRKKPEAGMISISQNDWHGRCECPKCKAIEEAEGSPSGLLVRFVNAVAADIAKEYPNFLMETLAYQYTRKAPKITRPASNVVIRLCSIEMNFAQSLETGPSNQSFRKDIEEWSAIAPNLFIWNYVTNFSNYLIPHPNYRNLANDIRFFVKHNAIGLFEQGDRGSSVGDFVRLRQWVIAHLQWNPDLDEKKLVNKFLEGYYGPAGKHLLNYINFLCDAVEKANINLTCFIRNVDGWLSPSQVEEAAKIYAEAEKAVQDNPVLAKRVRRERLTLDHVMLLNAKEHARLQRFANHGVPPLPDNILTLADEFIALTEGSGNFREGAPLGDYAVRLKQSILDSMKTNQYVPEICKGKAPDTWDVFAHDAFYLYHEGSWSQRVTDSNSTHKTVIRMPGNHWEWAAQANIPINFYDPDKMWRLVVSVRCEAASTEGNALRFGIYGTGLFHVNEVVNVSQCNGEKYVRIESKPFSIKELIGKTPYIWISPMKRPLEEVKAIYIDEAVIMQAD
ncbi:MAG: DUF4838 domain-containing protein [Victivallales bacterium]|nr:DUF4838 domain-containing protein [Victivallales bacterium]